MLIDKQGMHNGFVASHVIYALGLTKDRTAATYDRLIELARNDESMYVQSAALMAMGYLAKPARYERRHRLAASHCYTAGYDYIEIYYYML